MLNWLKELWLNMFGKGKEEKPIVVEPEVPVQPEPPKKEVWRHPKVTQAMVDEYAGRYKKLKLRDSYVSSIEWAKKRIAQGMQRYVEISQATGVPPEVIAVIHMKESSFNWTKHLHNGDPLTSRTTRVPAGRPKALPHNGRFYTFEESAIDALLYECNAIGIDPREYVWDVPNTLYFLERYNGMGYRSKGVPSAYLWAGSDQYEKGKFVRDGVWDSNAVAATPGTAVLLKVINWVPQV
jgi:lysozyme family protein